MSDRPQAHVSAAANSVETFNHRTFDEGPGWKTPPNAYDAVGPLARLARNLDQAVEQVGYPIDRSMAEGRVASDDGADPVQHVTRFKLAQDQARRAAATLAKALEEMHAAAGHMGYDTRGLPEYEDDLEDDRV